MKTAQKNEPLVIFLRDGPYEFRPELSCRIHKTNIYGYNDDLKKRVDEAINKKHIDENLREKLTHKCATYTKILDGLTVYWSKYRVLFGYTTGEDGRSHLFFCKRTVMIMFCVSGLFPIILDFPKLLPTTTVPKDEYKLTLQPLVLESKNSLMAILLSEDEDLVDYRKHVREFLRFFKVRNGCEDFLTIDEKYAMSFFMACNLNDIGGKFREWLIGNRVVILYSNPWFGHCLYKLPNSKLDISASYVWSIINGFFKHPPGSDSRYRLDNRGILPHNKVAKD